MSRDIWTQCEPKFKFITYEADAWRVVEAQHVIATRKLVESDEEQAILESLIDEAKPPQPYDEECRSYDFLLWTPFRYPPLKYGSRFGSPERRGLWYGSEKLETAFAEKAYYTFLFRDGSQADFGTFESPITAFRVSVKTPFCADLTRAPFDDFTPELVSRDSYAASQRVGSELRDRQAGVIRFSSARCAESEINIAVAHISAFHSRQPRVSSSWFCVSSPTAVTFKPMGFQATPLSHTSFLRAGFEVGGKLPVAR